MDNKPKPAKKLKTKSNTPGSIYLRGTKLWYKYKGKSFSTGYDDSPIGRKMANEMLENLHIETLKNNGKLPDKSTQKSVKIHDAINMWLEYKAKLGLKKSSLHNYKILLLHFPENKAISKNMIEANIEIIKSSINQLSTINKVLHFMQMFITWINDNEILGYPLKIKIEYSKIPQKPITIIKNEDYYKLYDYFCKTSPEMAQYIELLWLTGMRKMEAMNLLLSAIDMENGLITLSNKIKGTEEVIPIPDKLKNKLLAFIEKNKNRTRRKEYLFKISNTSAIAKFKKAKEDLGMTNSSAKASFHDFRRSYATNIIDYGLPIIAVKDLMRHKKIDTTLKLYRKVNAEKLKEYANDAVNAIK